MPKYMIGLDSGTSGIKAVLFDTEGNQIMKHGYPLTAIYQFENWFEEDTNEIWDKAKQSIAEITAQYPKDDIIGIGITAQGDGLWMIDKDGEPVRNGCCFCDGRAVEEFREWEQDGTIQKVFELSGTRMFTGNQPAILKWMDRHEPEALERAAYIMHLKDYLFYKLTGEITSDSTDQSLIYIDMKSRQYNKELFRLYGLEKYLPKYPPLKSCEENKANVLSGIARELGLSTHTVVTSGPMDVSACAIGAGVVESGNCCSIIGTAAMHEMVIDEPCADNIFAGMTVTHAMEGKCLRLMSSLAGTPNLEWFLTIFEREKIEERAAAEHKTLYQYVDEYVAKVPAGANGIMYHPYLLAGGERAPFINPNARASLTGISVKHNSFDILRACFEGVAFAMLDCYCHMPLEIKQITICGGGSHSAVWCQIFADVLGKKVITVHGDELGAKGTIISNAVAQGIFKDYYEAVSKTVTVNKTYEPNAENHKKYLKYFELYQKTYQLLMETWDMRHKIMFEGDE